MNSLYDIKIWKSAFSYIKKRHICFIPKRDQEPTLTENFRGIALSEVPYKILSKVLNKKVTPDLSKYVMKTKMDLYEVEQWQQPLLA